VSEFWGRRWNSAFHGLAFKFVFRPIARLHLHHGAQAALLAAFLLSGLVHELAISLPARGGYGLPTGYFILQGIGILVERALPQIRGRIFTVFITSVPAFWLFHPPFVHNVILPFMKAVGAL
jgi:Membrane bound O-acyl transferase family